MVWRDAGSRVNWALNQFDTDNCQMIQGGRRVSVDPLSTRKAGMIGASRIASIPTVHRSYLHDNGIVQETLEFWYGSAPQLEGSSLSALCLVK